MMQRAMLFCEQESEEKKRIILKKLCKLYEQLVVEDTTTTKAAFERNRIIEELTSNPDPLKHLKEESFNAAMNLYPKMKTLVSSEKNPEKRFKLAAKMALAGNIIEFGARDHRVNINELEKEILAAVKSEPKIDDSDRLYNKVKEVKEILYVTDNAAEVIFDKIFIEELIKYAKVCVAPLSRPVQDDASEEEIRKAGLNEICDIIPRSNFIGIWFDKCTPEFLKKFEEADLIIAKGMGCYETLIDYPQKLTGKICLLMKAKCLPVAHSIGVPVGGTVIKIL